LNVLCDIKTEKKTEPFVIR